MHLGEVHNISCPQEGHFLRDRTPIALQEWSTQHFPLDVSKVWDQQKSEHLSVLLRPCYNLCCPGAGRIRTNFIHLLSTHRPDNQSNYHRITNHDILRKMFIHTP